VHLVELHAQVGNAGARALPRFQVEQEGVAVLADGAQLVELRIEPGRDDAAVAQQRRRFVRDRGGEQRLDLGRRAQALGQHVQEQGGAHGHLGAQRRQRAERRAQAGQLARTHLAQGDAGGDALDVAHAAQPVAQRADAVLDQHVERIVALHGHGALAQRVGEPLAQRAAAHSGAAGVDQREEGRRIFAAQRLRQLEVAVGERRQVQQLAGALDLQRAHVCQRLALRVLGVGEQGGGGGVGAAQLLRIEAGEARHAELRAQLALAERGVELPGGAVGDGGARRRERRGHLVAIDQHLRRAQPRQPAGELALVAFGEPELGVGQPSQASPYVVTPRCVLDDSASSRASLLSASSSLSVTVPGVTMRTDLALDRTLGGGDIAHLLADRDRFAQLDQPGEVALDECTGTRPSRPARRALAAPSSA
jgi:hypothetical protein